MYAPTYLSQSDRSRLAEINQNLLTGISSEERSALLKEQAEIMGRRKTIQECTYEELQELRQQLYDQHQKHSAIGSKQVHMITRMLQQVELREATLLQLKAQQEKEKEASQDEPAKPRGQSRVSTKQSAYSWTVGISDDD